MVIFNGKFVMRWEEELKEDPKKEEEEDKFIYEIMYDSKKICLENPKS